MSLLSLGQFTLASGRKSKLKIDCDYLSASDIETAANLLAAITFPFGNVEGVPTGGLRLAQALKKYTTSGPTLITDDVWTTGGSVKKFLELHPKITKYKCCVIFARGPTPEWVSPLFRLAVEV